MPFDYLVIVPDDVKEEKVQKHDSSNLDEFLADGANIPQPPVSAKEAKIASRRKRVKKLLEDGLNFREIAATLGHKPQTISSDVRAMGQELKSAMDSDAVFYIQMMHYEMKRKELVHIINNSRSASRVIRSVKLLDGIDRGWHDLLFKLGILRPATAQDKEINVHMFCDEAHLAELVARAKPSAMNESAPSSGAGNSPDSNASQASVSEPGKQAPSEPSNTA